MVSVNVSRSKELVNYLNVPSCTTLKDVDEGPYCSSAPALLAFMYAVTLGGGTHNMKTNIASCLTVVIGAARLLSIHQ